MLFSGDSFQFPINLIFIVMQNCQLLLLLTSCQVKGIGLLVKSRLIIHTQCYSSTVRTYFGRRLVQCVSTGTGTITYTGRYWCYVMSDSFFIEVSVPNKGTGEVVYFCDRVSILTLSTILIFGIWNCSDSMVVLAFHFSIYNAAS